MSKRILGLVSAFCLGVSGLAVPQAAFAQRGISQPNAQDPCQQYKQMGYQSYSACISEFGAPDTIDHGPALPGDRGTGISLFPAPGYDCRGTRIPGYC